MFPERWVRFVGEGLEEFLPVGDRAADHVVVHGIREVGGGVGGVHLVVVLAVPVVIAVAVGFPRGGGGSSLVCWGGTFVIVVNIHRLVQIAVVVFAGAGVAVGGGFGGGRVAGVCCLTDHFDVFPAADAEVDVAVGGEDGGEVGVCEFEGGVYVPIQDCCSYLWYWASAHISLGEGGMDEVLRCLFAASWSSSIARKPSIGDSGVPFKAVVSLRTSSAKSWADST